MTSKSLNRIPLKLYLPMLVAWLREEFPTPYPVNIKFVKNLTHDGEEYNGLCWREGRNIEIRVRMMHNRWATVRVLMEEWAHASTMRHAVIERRLVRDHSDEWGLELARMVSRMYDGEGK